MLIVMAIKTEQLPVTAIGWVVVMGSIFGGYAMAGGHLGGLWQPLEVVMIIFMRKMVP